jgi:predicted RecB family nuclease
MINNETIVSYDICPTKSFKYHKGEKGYVSEYEKIILLEERKIKEDYLSKVKGKFHKKFSLSNDRGFVQEVELNYGDYTAYVDLIEINTKGEVIPIIFLENDKVSRRKKLELQWIKFILEKKGILISRARVISVNKETNIHFKNNKNPLIPIIQHIKDFKNYTPRIVLNRHCKICEFKSICREELEALDDLSLIDRITRKQISQYEKKGIFSLNQLSYTYKLRKRNKKFRENYLFKPELQALSIRTKKVYIQKVPEFIPSECELYFDIEGINERQDYYLFGILISKKDEESYHYFYSKGVDEEMELWKWFLKVINDYQSYPIYHYGGYDLKVIKKLAKKYNTDISRIINRFVNINASLNFKQPEHQSDRAPIF